MIFQRFNSLPYGEKPTIRCVGKLTDSPAHRLLHASCVTAAALLSAQAIAQQTPDVQMPQAPRAPTVESATKSSAALTNEQRYQAPELSGKLELNLQQADGQDSPTKLKRDTGEAEVQLTLDIEQRWAPGISMKGRLNLSTLYLTEDSIASDDDGFAYDLERLYVQFDQRKKFRLRVGRMGIRDPMETVVDENLDGVQVSFERDRLEFLLSQTREDWFEASTAGRANQISNTLAQIRFSPQKDSVWMPYVLHRSAEILNTLRPSKITWMGLQGIVEPNNSAIRYWLHASVQDGEESDEDERVELGGFLVDLGINWTAGGSLKPTFTAGVAHATGGSRDERFRQSGLHSNDFALNGKNSFRYLGEVMDPELTNIQIITLGVGADLSEDWSTDIALHHYQQVDVADNLRGSDIEYDPLGISGQLGTGADLVISYQPDKQFDIKATAGVFEPGDAFDDDRDMAWLAKVEIDYDFW